MGNDLQRKQPDGFVIPDNAEVNQFVNNGKGIQISRAEHLNATINMSMIIPGTVSGKSSVSGEYYNLFIGFDPFEEERFRVPNDRVLCEYISDEVKSAFPSVDDETIPLIRSLPCIAAAEDRRGCDPAQQAAFGFITRIRKEEKCHVVYFQKYYPFPMSVLRENQFEFAIAHPFELTRTHWTIKRVNLMEALHDVGVRVFH